jgi:hypothetical protein
MAAQGIALRALVLLSGIAVATACGSDDDDETPASYACLVGALVLTNFSGSCDMRATTTTPGECRAFYGSTTATASQACADLGGTFNEVDRCPSTSRVLRCAIEEQSSRILYSYYAPKYTEAAAADICSSRGGKCVRGSGD